MRSWAVTGSISRRRRVLGVGVDAGQQPPGAPLLVRRPGLAGGVERPPHGEALRLEAGQAHLRPGSRSAPVRAASRPRSPDRSRRDGPVATSAAATSGSSRRGACDRAPAAASGIERRRRGRAPRPTAAPFDGGPHRVGRRRAAGSPVAGGAGTTMRGPTGGRQGGEPGPRSRVEVGRTTSESSRSCSSSGPRTSGAASARTRSMASGSRRPRASAWRGRPRRSWTARVRRSSRGASSRKV